jgi:membrane associated rhomboid family serine protease
MIPLRSSERVRSRTPVTAALIAANVAVFAYQFSLNAGGLNRFVSDWGIVPDNLRVATLVTSMFLHGGWLHLIGNMWFLWVFGRNIEDSVGSGRFLGFYFACGLAAAVIHVITNPYSRIPTIGASGAIAGVMGAYLIRFPKTYIDTLVVLVIFLTRMQIPAVFFLIYWFVIQFFSGIGSLSEVDYTGGGVAWFAHIGGFVGGMLLIRKFRDRRPQWRPWYEGD